MRSPALPFIGIVAQGFAQGGPRADDVLGKPSGGIFGQCAVGGTPPGTKGLKLSIVLRAMRMVLGWRLRGRGWPHPFFDRTTRAPMYPVTVLLPAQRERLRALCGPSPSVQAGGAD